MGAPSRDDVDFYSAQISLLSFTPEKTEKTILDLIADARSSIEISLYGFENEPIADALIGAYAMRGVQVRVSSEFDSENSTSYQKLIRHGVPVHFGNSSGIMHNKYIIIDRKYLVTGSTNLTSGLFKHFNNTIVVKNEALIAEYLRDFEVQYAGYYATQKDAGYDAIIGAGVDIDWEPVAHQLDNSSTISAYFTPYKSTFPAYTANRHNDMLFRTDFSSANQLPNCSGRGAARCSASKNTCPPIVNTYNNQACFIPASGNGRAKICYSYLQYDCNANVNDEFGAAFADKCDEYAALPRTECRAYDNAMNQVIPLLRNAEHSILILAFAFRDRLVIHELIRAHQLRNVDVRVWIDYNQYRAGFSDSGHSFDAVARLAGFLKICRKPDGGLLHHKVIVVDGHTVILGSMNFSSNAVNNNDENFVIIRNNPAMATAFYEEAARIDQYSFHLTDKFREFDP